VLEWNRCSYVKNPRTGRRIARPNPPEQWEVKHIPELRIVDDAHWDAAKARQGVVRPKAVKSSPRSTATLHDAKPPDLPAVGPVALRLLRRRLHHHGQGPLWLRDTATEGHLRFDLIRSIASSPGSQTSVVC
jgi:hypothetical protein